jgi:hypothetical protein
MKYGQFFYSVTYFCDVLVSFMGYLFFQLFSVTYESLMGQVFDNFLGCVIFL